MSIKYQLEQKVNNAYSFWQMEENRDSEYDFELCRKLRNKYYEAQQELNDYLSGNGNH